MNRLEIKEIDKNIKNIINEIVNETRDFLSGMFRLNEKLINDNKISWFQLFLIVNTNLFHDSLFRLLETAIKLDDVDIDGAIEIIDITLSLIREKTLKGLEKCK